MVLQTRWVKHFSRTRTTTRTRTIIAGRGTCLLAPALITDSLITFGLRSLPAILTKTSPGRPLSWPMIVRQWKGWAQKDRASDYVRYFATQLQPKLSIIPGYKKALVLTREQGGETEIVTMTFFDRLEDVAGFAGDRYEVANVSAEAQKLLSHFDKTVSHFEVALETAEPTAVS
jgi:hypothetical protein